ncbi:unnamed protein product [Prunus armeniaca]
MHATVAGSTFQPHSPMLGTSLLPQVFNARSNNVHHDVAIHGGPTTHGNPVAATCHGPILEPHHSFPLLPLHSTYAPVYTPTKPYPLMQLGFTQFSPPDSELEKTAKKNARNKAPSSTTHEDGLISESKSSTPTPPRQHTTLMALTIPTAGQPLKSSLSARANNSPSCIAYPKLEEGTQFELKPGILNLLPSFQGLPKDDPYMHLKLYHEAVENIIIKGMEPECVNLRLFTYTLKDRAKAWLYSLPMNSITTWDQLQDKFFHASKTLALKKEISTFSQRPGEAFHETWDRFGELFMVSTSRPR